jgi:hypothetical protein
MIFWRIRFNGGTEHGYQVMDAGLNLIGVYDDVGNKITGAIDYHTVDSGADPTVGVTPPSWAGSINA